MSLPPNSSGMSSERKGLDSPNCGSSKTAFSKGESRRPLSHSHQRAASGSGSESCRPAPEMSPLPVWRSRPFAPSPGTRNRGRRARMPNWMRQTGAWPASPLTLLAEYISAMKAILSGAKLRQKADMYRSKGVELYASPKYVPTVYSGVRGPKSLAVSGRFRWHHLLSPSRQNTSRRFASRSASDENCINSLPTMLPQWMTDPTLRALWRDRASRGSGSRTGRPTSRHSHSRGNSRDSETPPARRKLLRRTS